MADSRYQLMVKNLRGGVSMQARLPSFAQSLGNSQSMQNMQSIESLRKLSALLTSASDGEEAEKLLAGGRTGNRVPPQNSLKHSLVNADNVERKLPKGRPAKPSTHRGSIPSIPCGREGLLPADAHQALHQA